MAKRAFDLGKLLKDPIRKSAMSRMEKPFISATSVDMLESRPMI